MNRPLETFETVLLAELRVGLPPLFYYRLMDIEDDWAFVLKLHSFFEGTLTKLLNEKLRLRPQGGESLTPRDTFVSRVHLASRMNLIEPDYHGFLLALNRLRNDITHNIRYIDFNLRRYVHGLSDADFRRIALKLCVGRKNEPADSILNGPLKLLLNTAPPRNVRTVREFYWHATPRLAIWEAGAMTLELLSLHFHFEESDDGARPEPDIEAKLQDLLHDPAVLMFRRGLNDFMNKLMTE